jgi:hypothetical protein
MPALQWARPAANYCFGAIGLDLVRNPMAGNRKRLAGYNIPRALNFCN